ncbi:hypothetical protein U879_14830 [Defluviimonas sp. 20V17]|uniref:Uncharacterized protein n=1 Tax=Allgaiera indica TaxID=765699 RepID=A0AAN4UR48_9RHOB|nr:hypothetical protein [Allgaiera indica]KDB02950.1 hypothetical protein U879_14830 [Defluviimonas sp. 20V17]GHE01422.1 hypothetical protein GCM10008024_16830 [Allgaiera indica]SDW86504.1 hypothetical protein SAMN05444006_107146 [Allgaiera indica]
MKPGAALLLLALGAGPALAEGGPSPAQMRALAAAMTQAGCVLDAANQDAVLKSAGLTAAEAGMTLDALVRAHRVAQVAGPAYRLEDCR